MAKGKTGRQRRRPIAEGAMVSGSNALALSQDAQSLKELGLVWNTKFLAQKCLEFSEALCGVTLYDYEREFGFRVFESLLLNDGEEITALFARQSGKTETIACVIDGAMVILPILAEIFPEQLGHFKSGIWIGLFAPVSEQAGTTFGRAKTRLGGECAEEVLKDPDIDDEIDATYGILSTKRGSFVRMHSASKQSNIESKTYHLLIIEECQDVDDVKIRKSIHPMGASTNATIVKIGTANTRKSEFYDSIQRNKRRQVKRASKQNHFQFDYKVVQKFNPKYKAYIQKEKERLGVDSDEFRMAYGLEFILERGMFLTEERFDEMAERGKRLKLVRSTEGGFQGAAMDVAKTNDSTLVTILDFDLENPYEGPDGKTHYPKTILNWLEIQGDDYESQFWQVVDFLEQYKGIQIFYIDATGVGDPVADRFINYFEDTMVTVVPYKYTQASKSVMYKYLNSEIIGGRIIVPSHASVIRTKEYRRFKLQMLDLEKRYSGNNMVCAHPDAKDAHDDYCDSMAMATLSQLHELMGEVVEEDNDFFRRQARGGSDKPGLHERLFGRNEPQVVKEKRRPA